MAVICNFKRPMINFTAEVENKEKKFQILHHFKLNKLVFKKGINDVNEMSRTQITV